MFNGVIIGATQSDYYTTLEGRDYDYGPGLGALVTGQRALQAPPPGETSRSSRIWIHTVNGANSDHYQDAFELRGPLLVEQAAWARGQLHPVLDGRSDYTGQRDVAQEADFFRAFVSTAIPALPK